MKTKSAKQPKQSKRTAHVKDLKPKKDAKGGDYVIWRRGLGSQVGP